VYVAICKELSTKDQTIVNADGIYDVCCSYKSKSVLTHCRWVTQICVF